MASINKNLDTIIAQAIHGPKVDGIPLYSKIDGTQEIGFNNRQGGKSEKWAVASQTTFTSPTNIRRLFIAGGKVVIQTYKPAIVRGKADPQGCWREFKLSGDNNLQECTVKSLNYQQSMSKFYMEKSMNPKVEAPDKITMKGTGLGALSSPWVASNVEEVYFDWTVLASETYRNAGIGCEELLMSYMQNKRGFVQSNLALDMFVMANTGNIKDIRARFPRLRCVGFISELGKILEVNFDRGKPGLDSIEDSIKLWSKLEANVNIIKQSNSLMVINEINDGTPLHNTTFALRDGIYRFDRDVLKQYFEDYERRVKDFLRDPKKDEKEAQAQVQASIDATKTQKSQFELLLDNLAETRCLADAKSVLILSLTGATVSEVNATFNEMSAAGAKKYRALLS